MIVYDARLAYPMFVFANLPIYSFLIIDLCLCYVIDEDWQYSESFLTSSKNQD